MSLPPEFSPKVIMQFERYQDFLREAEKERLIRLAREGEAKKPNLLSQALTWLGHQLVHWGCLLEKRYGGLLESPCEGPRNAAAPSTAIS